MSIKNKYKKEGKNQYKTLAKAILPSCKPVCKIMQQRGIIFADMA